MEAAGNPGVRRSMTAAEIESAIADAGLGALPREVVNRFQTYLELLLKWNARLNLTAIRDPEGILHRHFVECIFTGQRLPADIHTLLDFGSGGGFPGVPIALCRPEIRVMLGEAQARKASFLREVIRTLGLENADVFQGRVETLERVFDVVALRAVDKMQEACRAAVPKIAPEGYLVLLTTAGMAPSLQVDQISWLAPDTLPRSAQGLLLIGRRG